MLLGILLSRSQGSYHGSQWEIHPQVRGPHGQINKNLVQSLQNLSCNCNAGAPQWTWDVKLHVLSPRNLSTFIKKPRCRVISVWLAIFWDKRPICPKGVCPWLPLKAEQSVFSNAHFVTVGTSLPTRQAPARSFPPSAACSVSQTQVNKSFRTILRNQSRKQVDWEWYIKHQIQIYSWLSKTYHKTEPVHWW